MIESQLLLNPKPTLSIISPYCQEASGTLNANSIYILGLGGTEIHRQDFEVYDKYYLKIYYISGSTLDLLVQQ